MSMERHRGPRDLVFDLGPFHVILGYNHRKKEKLVREALTETLRVFRKARLTHALPARINVLVKGRGSQVRSKFFGYRTRGSSYIHIVPHRLRHVNVHNTVVHEVAHLVHYKKVRRGYHNTRVLKAYKRHMEKFGGVKETHTLLCEELQEKRKEYLEVSDETEESQRSKELRDLEVKLKQERYLNRYARRYREALVTPWMPTEYAKTNHREWFAEVLSARLLNPKAVPRSAKEWVRDCFPRS